MSWLTAISRPPGTEYGNALRVALGKNAFPDLFTLDEWDRVIFRNYIETRHEHPNLGPVMLRDGGIHMEFEEVKAHDEIGNEIYLVRLDDKGYQDYVTKWNGNWYMLRGWYAVDVHS